MATQKSDFQVKVSNYLVPATGGTAAVSVKYAGDGTEESPVDMVWKTYGLDGEPFNPSGFYAANFSSDSVFLRISGNDLVYEIPGNSQMGRMYPAPFDHVVSIYGTGDAEIVFVNSPVIPYGLDGGGSGGGGAVTVADGADVALGAIGDFAAFAPDTPETVISLLKGLFSVALQTDSLFVALPPEFDSWPVTLGYTGDNVTTIVKTDGTDTYTQTLTYTGANLTGISAWVKS
jgi:hypothetical protein